MSRLLQRVRERKMIVWCGPEPAGDGERGKGGERRRLGMLGGHERRGRARGRPGSVPPVPAAPGTRTPRPPGSAPPAVMDGLARNGLAANPQSAACWAQLDQQQASWYFWINTNKSSFPSWQVVLPPAPQPPVFPARTPVQGEREERWVQGAGSWMGMGAKP